MITCKSLEVTNQQGVMTGFCGCSQLYRAFQSLSAHCFGLMAHNFNVLVHSHLSHQFYFQLQQAAVFDKKA